MHWIFPEFPYKNYGCQVKEAIYKTVPSKFSSTIFSWPVLDNFFTKLFKAGPFCNQGNIPVHFTIYLDVFYHFIFISFQPAVKIVQVNATYSPGGGIK